MEIVRLTDGKEILIDHKGGRAYHIGVQATHEPEPGKTIRMELSEESDGTRRLLNLIPALHPTAFIGVVHVIDEIDRSLHPILVKEFLEFFLKSGVGEPRQVIVTTHESNLLDQELLRRDEIWFAEKDSTGATRLYSLLDFKVRNDLEIRKHYLQGRFGAIPFLGNLDSLLAMPDRHE
jgi:AAA15 family ATPase/GTPase